MRTTGTTFARSDFEKRLRRRERTCALVAITAASVHLAFMLPPPTAVVEGVVAVLIAAVGTRFGVGTRDDASQAAGRSARRVLFVVTASLAVSPVWVAMLDPTRGIAAAPWRSILISTGVCGGIAALIARQWTRLELDPEAPGLPFLLLSTTWGPLLLLGDGVARAHEQHWSDWRGGLAALALVGAATLLAGSLARRLSRATAPSRPRSPADASRREADRAALEAERFAALEAELDRASELVQLLGLERDRQAVEQVHASELVGGVGPVLQAGREAQTELFARLAAARFASTRLRVARDAIEGRADALSIQLESTTQQLVEADRMGRRRTVAATNLLLASRETASGLTDLGRQIETLEPATASLTELSLDVVARVELGRARLAETVAGMEAIRAATHSAETVIRGLAQRTREIGGILDVIDDVGDQTSLLALNAAIIAAQAGEHGRAFSVVAEEIRDLADRVLVGTKEVGGLIRAVQAESEQAIEAIEAGSAAVLQGVERSVDAGRAFDEITRAAEDSGERITSLVETVRTQSQALGRVESIAARIEEAARELAELQGARPGGEIDLERSAREGRAAAEELRAAVRDQTGELVRIEGELRLADERGHDAGRGLESGLASADAIARVIDGGGERVRALDAAVERLAANRRDLMRRFEALRAGSASLHDSQRTEPALRATGDPS